MSEQQRTGLTKREHSVLEAIAEAEPHMPEFRKGYLLGYGDGMTDRKNLGQQNPDQDQPAFAEE